MQDKEKILSDIQSLIQDIDKWTDEYVSGTALQNSNRIIIARRQLESLMVAAHQELSFLYDYIKEGGEDA